MKKFFLVLGLLIFVSFLGGCNFWWQNRFDDVEALNFYVYGDGEKKVNVELNVVPDFEKRTLAVNLMRYSTDEVDKANPGFVETDDGVIGGSNFDDFVGLLELLDQIDTKSVVNDPMLSVVVLKSDDEKKTYGFESEFDEDGKSFYEFYTSLSGLFAEDVY